MRPALTALLAAGLVLCLHAGLARAVEFKATALARVSSILRPGEYQPAFAPTPGGYCEIQTRLSPLLNASIGGSIGGTRQWIVGPGVRARLSLVEWTMRAGVGLKAPYGAAIVESNAFLEYGETNAWIENTALQDKGPRNIRTGGGVRFAIGGPRRWHLHPEAGLECSVYRAQADDRVTGDHYTWVGESLGLTVGFRLAPGENAQEPVREGR